MFSTVLIVAEPAIPAAIPTAPAHAEGDRAAERETGDGPCFPMSPG